MSENISLVALLSLIVGFLAVSANISGSNPTSGTCLCIAGRVARVRNAPQGQECGTEITQKPSGSCYRYTGQKRPCRIDGVTYNFFSIEFGASGGWISGTLLNIGSASQCQQSSSGSSRSSPSSHGGSISRNDIISRAQYWVAEGLKFRPPFYSQTGYHPDEEGKSYRRDCSGYVSMAWRLPISRSTHPRHDNYLGRVSRQISKSQLLPGDIMLRNDTHTLIFAGWTSSRQDHYHAYELSGGKTPESKRPRYHTVPYPYFAWGGPAEYRPYRFNNVN